LQLVTDEVAGRRACSDTRFPLAQFRVNNNILKPFTPPVLKEKIDQILSMTAGVAV
jgi:hypothetical protein